MDTDVMEAPEFGQLKEYLGTLDFFSSWHHEFYDGELESRISFTFLHKTAGLWLIWIGESLLPLP
jgi:hypothetical protein